MDDLNKYEYAKECRTSSGEDSNIEKYTKSAEKIDIRINRRITELETQLAQLKSLQMFIESNPTFIESLKALSLVGIY